MNIDEIRKDFAITNKFVYMDNASTVPYPRQVVDAVTKKIQERHTIGVSKFYEWLDVIEETRRKMAELMGAQPEEIAFTQNTSEGINIAANVIDFKEGDNVITNDLEYYPNIYPWMRLKKYGVDVRIVNHREGYITVEDIEKAADSNTKVITLSSVAWINGLKHDLEKMGELARSLDAYLVVDAIQQIGAQEIDMKRANIDFCAGGGHKWLMTLFGSGVFYCRQELIEHCEPVYLGWQSDSRSLEYDYRKKGPQYELPTTARRFNHGNSTIVGILALNAALNYMEDIGWEWIFNRNRMLADIIVKELSSKGIKFLSPLEEEYRSNIVTFLPKDPEKMISLLDEENIVVSQRQNGIRVSPIFFNTEEEIETLIDRVVKIEAGK